VHLIGLHGAARSGKSTVARYLVEQYGFCEVSFAAPLYRGLAAMLGCEVADLQEGGAKEAPIPWLGRSPRYLLQTLGTEWGRKLVREDLWPTLAARAIERHREAGAIGCVISDVRFDNEAEFVLARQGELWGITRLRTAAAVRAHESERGISTNYPSRGIINAEGFANLYQRVDQLLEELEARAA
jgi:hypothetical protein